MKRINSVVNFIPLGETPKRIRQETLNRLAWTFQNQSANPVWIAPHDFTDTRAAIKLEAGRELLRDFFCSTGNLYACTDAAGAAAGDGLTLGEDFGE